MRDAVLSPPADPDDELCARAAWLYYGAGLTQARWRSGSACRASRRIGWSRGANRLGLVRVSVDAPVGACIELEDALRLKFGLRQCVVAPDLDDQAAAASIVGAVGRPVSAHGD